MKKINLFKVVLLTLLVTLVLSWIIPASTFDGISLVGTSITPIPVFNIFTNIFDTLGYFSQVIVFVLVVGAFYGVLNSLDPYSTLVQKIAKKAKGKEKLTVVITIIFFAILASFVSLPFALFIFVPFAVSILLLLGIDKISALASTIGAISIGMIGSIFGYSLVGNINNTLGLDMTDNIITRIVMLILGVALLSFYVINKKQKVTAKEKNESDYDPLFVLVKKTKENNVLALSIILGLTFVLFVLGFITWNETFQIDMFNTFYTWFTGLELFGFPIIQNIFGTLSAFGTWSYGEISTVLIIMTIVIAFVYKMKINEYLIAISNGIKKLIPTSALVLLAIAVLVLNNSNAYSSITGTVPAIFDFFLGLTNGFNFVFASIPIMISGVFNIDPYYFVQFSLPLAKATIADTAMNPVLGLMFQSLYGFVTLFAPTSIALLAGLSYLDIEYTSWLKYIAKFLLQIIAVIAAVIVIVMLAI